MNHRTITPDELKKILADHAEWLLDSTKGARANLSSANLSYANLSSADLSCANLSYANLSSANLSCASLSSADLSYANLSSADLRCANLSYANLSSADLSCASLSSADLLIFQFQRHTAYFTFDGSLRIGCHVLPITEWAETYAQIGKQENYSAQQIKAYGGFIKICLEMFKDATAEAAAKGE